MSDGSTFAADRSNPSEAMFPIVRKNGFDPSHVLAWVKEANRRVSDLRNENETLQARIDTLEQMVAGELDEDTLVTTLGDETVRVLLAARQSAAIIKERAETQARQRMEEADEYAHRISTSAEHAVAAMTKEAEDRAATSRDEATRAVARIHSEAAQARSEADAHVRHVRAEAAELVRKAKEEADSTTSRATEEAAQILHKAKEDSDHALERADEDAAAVRRAATADANELRTGAERDARILAEQFQRERLQLLGDLRAARDQTSRTLAMLNEKRDTLAAVVAVAHQLHEVSAGLSDDLQALDVNVVGDDDLTAFEEDLGTSGIEGLGDDWYTQRRSAPADDEVAARTGAADAVDEDELDDLDDFDDFDDDTDDEFDDDTDDEFDEDADDDTDDEFDEDADDEFEDEFDDDELEDGFEDYDEPGDGELDDVAAGDVENRPANGADAVHGDAERQLGVAPWWKKRAAG